MGGRPRWVGGLAVVRRGIAPAPGRRVRCAPFFSRVAPTRVNAILAAVLVVVSLFAGLQLLVRLRARAMRGKAVPALPGELGQQLASAPRALVYFFSPSCGACKSITPRVAALRRTNPAVHLVDVFQDIDVARRFRVMGTPSFVELADGKIVGYHVGAAPAAMLARFS